MADSSSHFSSRCILKHFKVQTMIAVKKWSVPQQILLFGVLKDEFVAGLVALVAAHLPRSHSLRCVPAPGLPLLCFRFVQFLRTIISKCSAATFLMWWDLLSVSVKEFWKSVNIWRRCGQKFGVLFFDSLYITVEVLCSWYSKLYFAVRWNNALSKQFIVGSS